MSTLSVTSKDASGNTYQITAVMLSKTTASLDVREWEAGTAVTETPTTDNSYALDSIVVVGNHMTCKTSAMFLRPQIDVYLNHDVRPSIEIAISHTFFKDGTTEYVISEEDYDGAVAFLAGFNA